MTRLCRRRPEMAVFGMLDKLSRLRHDTKLTAASIKHTGQTEAL